MMDVDENQVQNNTEAYKKLIYITKNDNDADIMCDVCLDDFFDEDEQDDLVMCDGCNVAVHQSCYGHEIRKNRPQDHESWFCERC